MKKRVFVLLIAVIMLVSVMPLALAEDECFDVHVGIICVSAYCPVCGAGLYYRTYSSTRNGSGSICYYEDTYEQPYCLQHGDVYGAQLSSSHAFYHKWVTDYTTGKPKCSRCSAYNTSRAADLECESAPTFHQWATNYLSGSAQCVMCNLFKVKTLSAEENVCPNHKTFHSWVTNEDTGNPMCENCGYEVEIAE